MSKDIRWCKCGQPWVPAAGLYGTTEETRCQACGLRDQVERLRVQLAGCSVAACGGTSEPQVVKEGQYGWSKPYQEVLELHQSHDRFKEAAVRLWQLLDDIDSLDDGCRGNDPAFRELVREKIQKRYQFAEADGYAIIWKSDFALEQEGGEQDG
jgi:hypothetical protein